MEVTREMVTVCKWREEASGETIPAHPRMWDIWLLEKVKKNISVCKSPVCGGMF